MQERSLERIEKNGKIQELKRNFGKRQRRAKKNFRKGPGTSLMNFSILNSKVVSRLVSQEMIRRERICALMLLWNLKEQ
jgi:hypothetical protein